MCSPHVHSRPICFSLLSNSFSDAMLLRETEMVVDALSCMSHEAGKEGEARVQALQILQKENLAVSHGRAELCLLLECTCRLPVSYIGYW